MEQPGTAQVAGNILWFEFLLDPSLLESHLAKEKPDPSPIDLIAKFLGYDQKNDVSSNESEKIEKEQSANSFKSIAVKILTMKVMAYLGWDLDLLEAKFSPMIALQLLLDLLSMAKESEARLEQELYCIEYDQHMDHQSVFAVHLFHRWVLKAIMNLSLIWKQPRTMYLPTQGIQEPAIAFKKNNDFRLVIANYENKSIAVLRKMMEDVDSLRVPTIQSFFQPTETSSAVNTKWQQGKLVSASQFKCQIHFELATFLLFRRDHDGARHHVKDCLSLFEEIEHQLGAESYCRVDKKTLHGLAAACALPVSHAPSLSLIERFRESKLNDYKDMITILQMDNILREIPIIERDLLEVELQQAIAGGSFTVAKDLLMKLQVLNAIRRVMCSMTPSNEVSNLLKNFGEKCLNFFLISLRSTMLKGPDMERANLKRYLLNLLMKSSNCASGDASLGSVILADDEMRSWFSQTELDHMDSIFGLKNDSRSPLDSEIFLSSSIEANDRLGMMKVEHRLGESFDCFEIRNILQSLIKANPSKSWHRCNSRWDVPIPLQSVLLSLPKGFVQDFIFIILAKSKEMSNKRNFEKAIYLLEVADREAKDVPAINSGTLYKLSKLISWEALVLNISLYIAGDQKYSQDCQSLAASCKACLNAAAAGESVIPRLEVMESCVIALLNLGEWEYLMAMDRRLAYMELAAALASACHDLAKYKGGKKLPREAWDLILPVFGVGAQKRNNVGMSISSGSSSLTRSCLMNFLLQLRESTAITVATSILARMHNILRDEPTLEISCIHSSLWPAMISNSNSYSYKMVTEVLRQLTREVLKFMPNNVAVLKLIGDLSFASTDWAQALTDYLQAIAVVSEYFTQPIGKPVVDDLLVKRMIRCCTQLNCYTQAAVLCQCLDEVDYATAFRCLAETKNLQCADAMDVYYPCIWEITILEYLVNHHNKRGEITRKQQVVKLMGLLELNSNNNEEIQNEAAKIRKNQLFRALLQQHCASNRTFVGWTKKEQ